MKYLGIDYGWLNEEFCILPSLSLRWMTLKEGRFVDLTFFWLFWRITFGQIHKKLKEDGY